VLSVPVVEMAGFDGIGTLEIDKGAGLRIILSDETNNLCQIADCVGRIDYLVIHFGIIFRTSSAGVPPCSSIERIP